MVDHALSQAFCVSLVEGREKEQDLGLLHVCWCELYNAPSPAVWLGRAAQPCDLEKTPSLL